MEKKDLFKIIISCFVLFILAAVLFVFIFKGGYEDQVKLMVGAVIGYSAAAIQYWIGSSKGSADKNDLLRK